MKLRSTATTLVVTLGREDSRKLQVHVEGGGSSEQTKMMDRIHLLAGKEARAKGLRCYEIYASKRYGGHMINQVYLSDV